MLPGPQGSCTALLPGTTTAVTRHRHGAGLAAASSWGCCWWLGRGLSSHCIILVSVTRTAATTGSTVKKIPGSIIVTRSTPGPLLVLKKGLRSSVPQIIIWGVLGYAAIHIPSADPQVLCPGQRCISGKDRAGKKPEPKQSWMALVCQPGAVPSPP